MNNVLHLTDDQIDDHLIGDLAPAPAAHLAACELCQARVAEAGQPLASFREVSLAWAERKSATLPARPAVAPSRAPQRLAWASAATAVLAVGIAVPVMHERTAASPSHPAADTMAAIGHTGISSVTPVAASPQQIAQDNAMLDAIDRELTEPGSNAFSLAATAATRTPHAHARTLPD